MANITITNEDLGVKKISIKGSKTVHDRNGNRVLLINSRLYKSAECRCPLCLKKCPIYDTKRTDTTRMMWRSI